jgi:hypothetical protein
MFIVRRWPIVLLFEMIENSLQPKPILDETFW